MATPAEQVVGAPRYEGLDQEVPPFVETTTPTSLWAYGCAARQGEALVHAVKATAIAPLEVQLIDGSFETFTHVVP